MHKRSGEKRGDSLIEVMFSVGVFGLVAIGSVGVMNRGLYTAQNSLELTMARNEIDAQAEALRFIHAAYTAEINANIEPKTGSGGNYSGLWQSIINKNGSKSDAPTVNELTNFISNYENVSTSCTELTDAKPSSSYAINYRGLRESGDVFFNTDNIKITNPKLATTPVHPRIIFEDLNPDSAGLDTNPTAQFANVNSAQGIWVTTVRDASSKQIDKIQYFDFYIRTCWDRLGGGTPNTISTVVRLYNPDYVPHT